MLKIALGFSLTDNFERDKETLRLLDMKYRDNIYDLHFSHYDNNIVASGRDIIVKKEELFRFIDYVHSNYHFKLTLLMNVLLHNDYELVLNNFEEDFYSRGIRSVVIADLELIKLFSRRFKDVEIQGSCLSYRMTEQDLEEEAREGISLHNPSVDIIRDIPQLIKNHKSGYKQKILFAEGCLHKCTHEKGIGGHRWSIARRLYFNPVDVCTNKVKWDIRHFYKANWITIAKLRELEEYIDVVKFARGSHESFIGYSEYPIVAMLDAFFDTYYNNKTYNVLDYNAVQYKDFLSKTFNYISSDLFTNEFFNRINNCENRCSELNCNLCYEITRKLKKSKVYREKSQNKRGFFV